MKLKSTATTKLGLAEMLKGGVIMDVIDAAQAEIAQAAGAVAVMALERVPAQIRAEGGVARASDPAMIQQIQRAVSIPVMAKCRIGHTMEARILEALEVDFIDESEVLTPADEEFHIGKQDFHVPFVCGCRDLGEALRRVAEGASLLRTKGEAGTGDVAEAVRHLRKLRSQVRRLTILSPDELVRESKELGAPLELVREVARTGRLPVPNFAAGGIATPADAALCMALGAESVFVGSGIFLSEAPRKRARAIVLATTAWQDPQALAEISAGLGMAMRSVEIAKLGTAERFAAPGESELSRIGILAVQGAFAAHAAVLARLGHTTREVRDPRDLDGLDGLVLPGGESTVQLTLIDARGLHDGILALCRAKPVLATCAGMILLARRVQNPAQRSFGLLDVSVARNAWGRQVDSFEACSDGGRPLVFIRAPRLLDTAPQVEVLDRYAGEPIAVRERGMLALTFHPELVADPTFHALAFATRTP